MQIARLISFALMASIFLYPALVMGILSSESANVSNALAYSQWWIRISFIIAIIAPLCATRVSNLFLSRVAGLTQGVKRPEKLLAAWLISTIVGQALRDIPANIGLCLSLLTRSPNWCLFLGLISFFAIGKNWPNRQALETLLKDSSQDFSSGSSSGVKSALV